MMQRILHPCVSFAQLDPEFVSMAKQFKLFKKNIKLSSGKKKKKTLHGAIPVGKWRVYAELS